MKNVSGIKKSSDSIISQTAMTQESVISTDKAVDELNDSSQFIGSSISEITDIIQNLNRIASDLVN